MSKDHNFTLKAEDEKFEVQISPTTNYGYFEHHTLGDECGGGLWFDNDKVLVDYDGVCELPKRVEALIRQLGYTVEEDPEYLNYYRHCGKEWQDTWSCMCNDRCPVCNAEIEPYKSEDA